MEAASVDAATSPAVAVSNAAAKAMAVGTAAAGGAPPGPEKPYDVTFVVKVDGDTLAKQQARFLNGRIQDAIFNG